MENKLRALIAVIELTEHKVGLNTLKDVLIDSQEQGQRIKEIAKKLELAYGCLIGSHTANTTPEGQFKNIIQELKSIT